MQAVPFTFKDLYLLNHLFWSFIFSDKKFRILYLRILLFVILFKHQVNWCSLTVQKFQENESFKKRDSRFQKAWFTKIKISTIIQPWKKHLTL